MALRDDPAPSEREGAGPLTVGVSACTPAVESRPHAGVSVVLPDPGGDHGLAAVLEHLPDAVDELLLLEPASGGDGGVLQRAGLAAARNDCIVMVGPDADLPAIGRFVEALRAGCGGVRGHRAQRAG
jgi:hypothetical protein